MDVVFEPMSLIMRYLVPVRKPGPPKEPKIMAQYPQIETVGSIGSIILAILEVQEAYTYQPNR